MKVAAKKSFDRIGEASIDELLGNLLQTLTIDESVFVLVCCTSMRASIMS